MISLDGFRHDYVRRVATPHFDRLGAEGAHAGRLIPPNPSLTFPGHASLATGVRPEVHGILANRFFDRARGSYSYDDDVTWYNVDPLWIHATRQGVRTHVFHWVGSAGARDGVAPAEWRRFSKIKDDVKVAQILAWTQAPEATRPRLIMSYFAGCDHVGHEHGPQSRAVEVCIGENDARLGRVLAGLAEAPDRWTLVLVSDHGMTATQAELNPLPAFKAAGVKARIVLGGSMAHVYLDAGQDLDAALAVGAALPHTRAVVPTERHATRTGDLMLLADFGVRYSTRPPPPGAKIQLAGHHGGDPSHPDMGAILYLWGAGVSPGAQVAQARAVDVVPTVCRLLGIAPPTQVEGAVQSTLLR
jgi:predicted AlkP superfamily pyrophosphatase or phosphodiesterase